MNKKINTILVSLALLLGIGGTSIYALEEVQVKNHFSTGIVDISLDEFRMDINGKEIEWSDMKAVLPGEKISKIPRIRNLGKDCYVRARVNLLDAPVDAKDIYGMSENWIVSNDGYYYYTKVLETNETVDLFEGFQIPEDLNEELMEKTFQVKIDVDAIQSQNFTPDYSQNHPWGNVEILECTKEGMYDVRTFKQSDDRKFEIRYEGEAGRLLKNEDDFFENFPVLMPGDIYTESLTFNNDSDKDVNLYFRTSALEGSILLDQIHLKIKKTVDEHSEIIYDGKIRAEDLNEGILLSHMEKETSGTLTYEIHVPDELNNEYTILEDQVVWVFSTEIIEDSSVETSDPVPTGDNTLIVVFGIMIFAAILSVVTILLGIYTKGYKLDEKNKIDL